MGSWTSQNTLCLAPRDGQPGVGCRTPGERAVTTALRRRASAARASPQRWLSPRSPARSPARRAPPSRRLAARRPSSSRSRPAELESPHLARTDMPGVSSTGERSGAVVIPGVSADRRVPQTARCRARAGRWTTGRARWPSRSRGRGAPSRLRAAPAPAEAGSGPRRSSTADSPPSACPAPPGAGRCRPPSWLVLE
jgi:hypothetical protein